MQPSFFTEVSALLTADRLPAWRAWAKWRADQLAGAVPVRARFVDENFGFYGTVLSGTPELRERWKRGVALVEGSLGEAVGKVYVERHFSPAAKERMDDLVANLIEAYRRSITDLDWMTDGDQGRGAGQAGEVPAAHRLSRPSGATTPRWRSRPTT